MQRLATEIGVPKELFPFQSNTFRTPSGANMAYLDQGSGEAVLMVHGNPTWSFFYRGLVRRLERRFRCVVPDHVGCGLSDKPNHGYQYTLSQRVADLEALVDEADLERFHLVAHDWGGMIGTALAVRMPERIKSMTLMNTAAFKIPEEKSFPFALHLSRLPVVGSLLIRGFNAFAVGATQTCVTQPLSPEVETAYLAPYRSWRERVAIDAFVKDIPLGPVDESYPVLEGVEQELDKLARIPKQFLWGMKDFVFDEPFLRKWQSFFSDATVVEYPEAGHYLLEDAAESVEIRIEAFLGEAA